MKKSSLRFLPALLALVFATAGSLMVATVVDAQTRPDQSMRPMPPNGAMRPGGPGEAGMHGGPGMRMMKEVERLKASLRLNASQSALWDKAVAQMKPPANLRDEMKATHDRMMAALADPDFNPRVLAADMDRMETERRARTTAIRDTWFSVYDSLDPAQRGQVREFLRERMSHDHNPHHGGWGRHHGDEHGDQRGDERPGRPMPEGAPPPAR